MTTDEENWANLNECDPNETPVPRCERHMVLVRMLREEEMNKLDKWERDGLAGPITDHPHPYTGPIEPLLLRLQKRSLQKTASGARAMMTMTPLEWDELDAGISRVIGDCNQALRELTEARDEMITSSDALARALNTIRDIEFCDESGHTGMTWAQEECRRCLKDLRSLLDD